MSRKIMTNEEFIERVRSIHGDRFDCSNIKFTTTKNNVIIIDSDLIEYNFHSMTLLKGSVPTIRSAINKNKAFEILARKIHGSKYDYSKSIYINTLTKVKIICPIHGEFEQVPRDHLNKCGCNICNKPKIKFSNIDFINKAKIYSPNIRILREYKNFNTKILISDLFGNQYLVYPQSIIDGVNPQFNTCTNKNKLFIYKSNLVHNNKYEYNYTKYKNSTSNVIITCRKHGDFLQSPANHLQGCGCMKCRDDKNSKLRRDGTLGFSLSGWIKQAKNSLNFESYKVYILSCCGNGEEFIKIGRTFTSLFNRFDRHSNLPYEYSVIKIIYGTASHMFYLENKLKKICKQYKYSVEIPFNGMFECFTIESLILLKDYIDNGNIT